MRALVCGAKFFLGQRSHHPARLIFYLLTFIVLASDCTHSQETCEYPQYFGTHLVPADREAGEFYIGLSVPDLNDKASIQNHMVSATIFARLLQSELRRRTQGLCEAPIGLARFPDLRVFLYVSRDPRESDRAYCVDSLRSLLVNPSPSKDEIENAAASQAAFMSARKSNYSRVPAGAASFILDTALAQIYADGTVMHALFSVDRSHYQQIGADDFLKWLDKQRRGLLERLYRIHTNCAVPLTDDPSYVDKRFYSSITPPHPIDVTVARTMPALSTSLRYMVITGVEGRQDEPMHDLAEKTMCNQKRVFNTDDGDSKTVTIKCLNTNFYDIDSWRIYFMEPEELSDREAKEIMTKLATDSGVLMAAQGNREEKDRRGPYVVHVQIAGE
jgi:hypothetical protein